MLQSESRSNRALFYAISAVTYVAAALLMVGVGGLGSELLGGPDITFGMSQVGLEVTIDPIPMALVLTTVVGAYWLARNKAG